VKRGASFRVLVAVEPTPFVRLIEHVLEGHRGLRVVGRSSRNVPLALQAARLAPDVIITNTRLHRRAPADLLAALKRSSPDAKLILLTHDLDASASPWRAEEAFAYLPEAAVIRQLLPVIRKLVARSDVR
jgi:DNA-binding NarL/FixJ family response regulator